VTREDLQQMDFSCEPVIVSVSRSPGFLPVTRGHERRENR
jgi:hypothetical protein